MLGLREREREREGGRERERERGVVQWCDRLHGVTVGSDPY